MSSESDPGGGDQFAPKVEAEDPTPTFKDIDGIRFGCNPTTNEPVIIDRFDGRWNSLIVGGMGASKATACKQQIRQEVKDREDVQVVVIDLLGDFEDLTWELDGSHVPVGGVTDLNPLELHEPDDPGSLPEAVDPLTAAITRGVAWFESYVEQRYDDALSDEERGVLTAAIRRAYDEKGITHEVSTHGKLSPTIADVVPKLSDIAHDPLGDKDVATEQQQVTDAACDLLTKLAPLCGKGTDAHFTRPTKISALAGEQLTRLDIFGDRSSGTQRLLLQALLGTVLEQAKQTTDRMMVVIDQAHILCETAFGVVTNFLRTGRHYGVSVQLLVESTGSVESDRHGASLTEQCSIVQIHRMAGDLGPLALEMSSDALERIRTAQVRTRAADHLEAVLDVGGTTIPLCIDFEQSTAPSTEHNNELRHQ